MTYLDYNTAAPLQKEVKEAIDFSNFGDPSVAVTKIGMTAKAEIEKARNQVAQALNVDKKYIYFTTRHFDSIVLDRFSKNPAFQATLHMKVLRLRNKLDAVILQVDKNGQLKKFNPSFDNIILEHVNAEIGTIQSLNMNKGNAKLIVDGTYAFGKVPVDLKNVDFYYINSNAFGGPRELNIVYSKQSIDEWGSVALIKGASKAMQLASKNFERNTSKWKKFQKKLIKNMTKLENVSLNGPERRASNNVNLRIKDIEGEAMVLSLDLKGIQCSTGSACSSKTLEASHVLLAIGQKPEEAHGSLRFTFGPETTEKDINKVIEELPKVIRELNKITIQE